ncbi:AbiEi antitoxin N-terminal domain-containing protein [Ornithinimicrobium faecis]|uniref:AbiEi antitoxin N-terminal domain-containing protein n=1 Tax=Ornithinimicrobium faecis TaxID=2934158 RepID=A0ABY4YZT2_9MICO|nr:AbiEi antitoxin N-terminal domain-containing protein [Ornithinimicrobium sp. HY1793]USQ81858.1 AbiEi antitoxin N-terminal domain-containing protein [Ornithinimicrobium sp. HY1793]
MDHDETLLQCYGIMTTALARRRGLTLKAIAHRVRTGRWQRVYRGVYLTNSGSLSWETRAAAALASIGLPAVLGGFSALAVYGLEKKGGRLHILVPNRRSASCSGARVVRVRAMPNKTYIVKGLRVVSVAHAVIDVADRPGIPMDDVIALCAKVCQQEFTTAEDLIAELSSRRAHLRRADLRLVLGDIGDGIESLAEHRFLQRVVRAHGLPEFSLQVQKEHGRVDFVNDDFRLVVEVDGMLWHAGDRFRSDRRRDRKTSAEGGLSVRVTWWDVSDDPCDTAADLAKTLRHRGWTGTPRPCSKDCPLKDNVAVQ